MNPLESKVLALNISNKAANILHEQLIKILTPYLIENSRVASDSSFKIIPNARFIKKLLIPIPYTEIINLIKSTTPELNNPDISLSFQLDERGYKQLIWDIFVSAKLHPDNQSDHNPNHENNQQPVRYTTSKSIYVADLNDNNTIAHLLPIIDKYHDFKYDEINQLKERYDQLKDELDGIKRELRPFFGLLD